MAKTLVVGLGNPGQQYEKTLHNLGFLAIDQLAEQLGATNFSFEKKFNGLVATAGDGILLKPQTFMNASGQSVANVVQYYKIEPKNIYLIHDEFAVPYGELKISFGKGPANHHGVSSVLQLLGTDNITRFRMGIGNDTVSDLASYVLAPLSEKSMTNLIPLIDKTSRAIEVALTDGIDAAMNQFNK